MATRHEQDPNYPRYGDQAVADTRTCTCHPDDNPPVPCPRRFAYSHCVAAALADEFEKARVVQIWWREPGIVDERVLSNAERMAVVEALRAKA